MSTLYLCSQGSTLCTKENRFLIKKQETILQEIPIHTITSIEIYGIIQVTTKAIQRCLQNGIDIIYYSTKGQYFGRLISTSHTNTLRQRIQANIPQEYKLKISQKIIQAKINNQIVILKRVSKNRKIDIKSQIKEIQKLVLKIPSTENIEELMGYEGISAKHYFKILGTLVLSEFQFEKRSKRPPLDEFNSLISLGYTILMNRIYTQLQTKGLNPYFGIMHKDRQNHPTLASDIVEPFRALIDNMVVSSINRREIRKEHFYKKEGKEGIFLTQEGLKIYINKQEELMRKEENYTQNEKQNLRKVLDIQINDLAQSIENVDFTKYNPVILK